MIDLLLGVGEGIAYAVLIAVAILLAADLFLDWRRRRRVERNNAAPIAYTATARQRAAWQRERLDINTAHRGRWA